ncbi:hypothetical protein CW745_06155 [Psychromonas sp. psych-6C06]|uniref:hypothetical protein n=1 Tax=Psychromonas sp. psych-6C06 TaxID=2058089 RepID=UPI000C31C8CC|nr:hypothetical protein [Psychromonas sp. psych-6C06]PKF63006.1 hypothetical protein CW745_06155 [Psychromonas sp. psych-6C06]
MNSSKISEYYKKDRRILMMLVALGQMSGMLMLPLALIVAFWDWKIGLGIATVGVFLFWQFGDLNVACAYKWTQFSGSKVINSMVLYAEVESPETAEKFKFVSENLGGLYREKDELVLGTLQGEVRCNVNEFSFEAVNKSSLVNYINITLAERCFAMCPVWDGDIKDLPNSQDKNEWAMNVISSLVNCDSLDNSSKKIA